MLILHAGTAQPIRIVFYRLKTTEICEKNIVVNFHAEETRTTNESFVHKSLFRQTEIIYESSTH